MNVAILLISSYFAAQENALLQYKKLYPAQNFHCFFTQKLYQSQEMGEISRGRLLSLFGYLFDHKHKLFLDQI